MRVRAHLLAAALCGLIIIVNNTVVTAQPPWTLTFGVGLTLLSVEGQNVIAVHGAVKLELCPYVALAAELGQGVLGWRPGEVRFSGFSALIYMAQTQDFSWFVGMGMGDYQCPCVGTDVYACLLGGVQRAPGPGAPGGEGQNADVTSWGGEAQR